MPDTPLLSFRQSARTRGTALLVAGIWALLVLAWLYWEAAPLVLALPAAFTLPALWDLWHDRQSALTLTGQEITWESGRRSARIDLEEIDYIRLDTRLDLSVRATVVLKTGTKIRVPPQCTPPHRHFEKMLETAGIPTQRHHFALMQ